jgi:alkanesulfonate monooxygenase SsuD/methylene tetrahydromethanopterin reductase-like flavin-dependent oxidoreductase (luciferase family)
VTMTGRFHTLEDAVLRPRPRRRPTLMVGSFRERVLRATLPHVDVWNVWYEDYGNTLEGFVELTEKARSIAEEVGRPWKEVERSVCVLVAPEGEERPDRWEAPPLTGTTDRIVSGLRDFADAGADEAILVLSPITERSIRDLGRALALLDG